MGGGQGTLKTALGGHPGDREGFSGYRGLRFPLHGLVQRNPESGSFDEKISFGRGEEKSARSRLSQVSVGKGCTYEGACVRTCVCTNEKSS